jgi:hypothetical protein
MLDSFLDFAIALFPFWFFIVYIRWTASDCITIRLTTPDSTRMFSAVQHKLELAFQGVSRMQVLVPADEFSPGDGYATFIAPSALHGHSRTTVPPKGPMAGDHEITLRGEQQQVHVVRERDLLCDWMQKSKISLREIDFVNGVAKLKAAYMTNDATLARDAYSMLIPFLEGIGIHADSEMADFYTAKLKPDGRMAWPMHHYQQLITNALDEVRLVWWWPIRTHSTLAAYCPTWRSALILANQLERFRMCPCGRLFIPRKAITLCCCKKHTNYYRLKRWRRERNAERRRSQ